MTKTLLDRIELWLLLLGEGAAIGAALMQIGHALSPGADEILKGITAGAVLAALLAFSSLFIRSRYPALGFVLRFTAAFLLCLFFLLETGSSRLVALTASIALLLSSCLILIHHLKEAESRGISRM